MSGNGAIEHVLKRDRAAVIAALSAVIVASWIYVLAGAGMGMSAFDMSSLPMALGQGGQSQMEMPAAAGAGGTGADSGGMSGGSASGTMASDTAPATGAMAGAAAPAAMPAGEGAAMSGMPAPMKAMATPAGWTPGYAVLMFFMWWIMMIAMMLPSAAPMILLHAAVERKGAAQRGESRAPWGTAAFAAGYLAAWAGFSAVAAALQWGFESAGLLSPMMMNSTSALLAGGILIFAGLYQLTPLKQACLRHCRGPIQFLTGHWRPGAAGALRMGFEHGAYCLGCCWGLMAILFFGGIMNLYWIIGLAVIVLLEKVMPAGQRLSLVTGALFLAWGAAFLYGAAA